MLGQGGRRAGEGEAALDFFKRHRIPLGVALFLLVIIGFFMTLSPSADHSTRLFGEPHTHTVSEPNMQGGAHAAAAALSLIGSSGSHAHQCEGNCVHSASSSKAFRM